MLYLWMPEGDAAWQWSKGEKWIQSASLEQLIQDIKLYQGEDAVVFFPSRDIQIVQHTLNKAQYKQLGTDGIKYLLEEFVILPIDQMNVLSHFEAPDQVSVMGIAKNAVLTMQHALTLIPVKVVALLPDFLILPAPEANETVLANINGRLLIRNHLYQGTSVDNLGVYLSVAPPTEYYKYDGLTSDQSHTLLERTGNEKLRSFNYQFTPIAKAKSHAFNVLPKAKTAQSEAAGYWKACAMLVLAILVVQFSYDLLRWAKLKQIGNQTAAVAIGQYQSWFGANSQINEQNLKSQFESHLRLSQGADIQALRQLSRIGPVLMQHQIVANRVNYSASVLSMDLVAQSADVLQSLVAQLNQQGFKAELGNIQTQNTSVVGSVKIK